MILDAKVPAGPLAEKWDRHRFECKLVNPANKRKFDIIVVGAGLAGRSPADIASGWTLPASGGGLLPTWSRR